MTFLYSLGFPMLGHVQSGNIFIDKAADIVKVGGYEGTILGYKTRLYRLCRRNLEHLDIIMFGRLLQWNLSKAVTIGPNICGCIREVAAICKT